MTKEEKERHQFLYTRNGLTKAEQQEFRRLDNALWVETGTLEVGSIAMMRLIADSGMRVEVVVVAGLLKIEFGDSFDDGSSFARFSSAQMDGIVAFYQKHRQQ